MKYQKAKVSEKDKTRSGLARTKSNPNAAFGGPFIELFELQQTVGNRAIGSLIQPKLKISRPNDPLEKEADRIADEVMRMPTPAQDANATNPLVRRRVQRLCVKCEKELQHQSEDEKGNLVQAKCGNAPTPGITPEIENYANNLNSRGTSLPHSVRSFMEPRFGVDFSDVRLHTDAEAVKSAKDLNAQAYTVGKHVVFAPGCYAPHTSQGRQLMAHELTHVIQQTDLNGNSIDRVVQREEAKEQNNEGENINALEFPGLTRDEHRIADYVVFWYTLVVQQRQGLENFKTAVAELSSKIASRARGISSEELLRERDKLCSYVQEMSGRLSTQLINGMNCAILDREVVSRSIDGPVFPVEMVLRMKQSYESRPERMHGGATCINVVYHLLRSLYARRRMAEIERWIGGEPRVWERTRGKLTETMEALAAYGMAEDKLVMRYPRHMIERRNIERFLARRVIALVKARSSRRVLGGHIFIFSLHQDFHSVMLRAYAGKIYWMDQFGESDVSTVRRFRTRLSGLRCRTIHRVSHQFVGWFRH